MLEYRLIVGEIYQHFLSHPYKPVGDYFYPSGVAGMELEVDENKGEFV